MKIYRGDKILRPPLLSWWFTRVTVPFFFTLVFSSTRAIRRRVAGKRGSATFCNHLFESTITLSEKCRKRCPILVRLRPPGRVGGKGWAPTAQTYRHGTPAGRPGYAASAGARSELAMDCPRGLPTFFQYGAGTSGAEPAPRVPAPGAAPDVPCRGAAPQTCRAARALDEAMRRLLPRYARDTLEM